MVLPDEETQVKGPGLRVRLETDRIWRCPACGKTVRSPGDVGAVACGCLPDGQPWMKMEEPRPHPRPAPTSASSLTGLTADEIFALPEHITTTTAERSSRHDGPPRGDGGGAGERSGGGERGRGNGPRGGNRPPRRESGSGGEPSASPATSTPSAEVAPAVGEPRPAATPSANEMVSEMASGPVAESSRPSASEPTASTSAASPAAVEAFGESIPGLPAEATATVHDAAAPATEPPNSPPGA